MTLAAWLVLFGVAVVLDVAYQHRAFARGIRRQRQRHPRLDRYPSITVVRPVRGRDVDAEENFRAALDTGYPGEVETLFVFDDERDPGLPVARAVVAEHQAAGLQGAADVLVVGAPPHGRTGKLNAMIEGLARARGELVAFGDSDTRPDRDVLRVAVETLDDEPRAGCAFAPVVVPGPGHTAGDLGYAMLLNAWYGPAVAAQAGRAGDFPFIMGQLMVFRREAIQAIGGLACADGQLTDDMYLGLCVARAGYRNVMSAHPLTIVNRGMSLSEFAKLFRRWLLFSRNGLPSAFTWPLWQRGLAFWFAVLGLGFALATSHPLAALAPLAGLVAYQLSMVSLQRIFGGERVSLARAWVPLLIPIVAPFVYLSGFAHPQVEWRGRRYVLGAQARLA